jgi:putative ABC transport system permease protein
MPDHPPRNVRALPTALARIKQGLTIAEAQRRIDTLVASLQKRFPGDYPSDTKWRIRLVPLKESIMGSVRQPLILLLAAMGFVLVIGCVNIANLLLARANTRGREMAIREALGAGWSRLTRQLLTESLLLSMAGGMIGLAILLLAQGFLVRLVPQTIPRFNDLSISWGVLGFALIASLVCGLIFGLAPAWQIRSGELTHALKLEGRGSTGSIQQRRTRSLLVVTEFALSLVLLIAAGLLLHSFWDLLNARLGFDPESVMTVKTRLPYPNDVKTDVYPTAIQQTPFFREVLRRCRGLPGVQEAAFGDLGSLPLGHDRNNQNPPVSLIIEGQEVQSNDPPLVDESRASPEYFHLMGMTLLRGRLFNDFDDPAAEPVAVINESMAQTFWPNDNPLGKQIKLSRRATSWTRIVGIVGNVRSETLEDANIPQIYSNLYQRGAKHLVIFLRGKLDSAAPELVRKEVQSIDPTIPVFAARPLHETVAASLSQRRFSMEMVALFALIALLLAAFGIYGVISYIVTERTHEIGIRLALGARHSTILRMVLSQGLRLAFSGAAIGVVCAVIVGRFMQNLLYGIKPTDPLTFTAVVFLLTGISLLACYFPARRAMRVNPMIALRHE